MAGGLPQIAAMRGKPFPNDHLDLFFNAVADSAIVLATFMRAAAAVGLGCCPISAVRDQPVRERALDLPERVIPVAGLCVGWPAEPSRITPRLGLELTLHEDRYGTPDFAARHRRLRPPPRGAHGPMPASACRSAGVGQLLRLVRGQGAAICRALAGHIRRIRARQGFRLD